MAAAIMWGVKRTERQAMKPAVHDDEKKSVQAHGMDVAPLVLRLRPVIELSGDQLLELSSLNDDLRLELTAGGELIVMPPAGGESSRRNMKLAVRIGAWSESDGTGVAFDSSGGFILPNGAIRSPDASWVERSRYGSLTTEQRKKFLPLCPDFVVELRSPSDALSALQEKMVEYVENGARLGWLIDPTERRVYVYRPGAPLRQLDNPEKVSGEDILPGFVLEMRELW